MIEIRNESTKDSTCYCDECLHVEVCKWYGYEGCQFRDTYKDIYDKGYKAGIEEGQNA